MTLTCARLQWFSPLNHCFIPDTTFVSFEELAVKIGFTCSCVIIFLSFGLDNTTIFLHKLFYNYIITLSATNYSA